MNFTLLTTAIAAAISGVAGFGLAWQLQAGNLTQKELDYAAQRIEVARASRIALDRAVQAGAKAQTAAAARGVVNRASADRAASAGTGLRIKTADIVRSIASDPDACNSVIAAYDAILTEGSGFIREVARDADQCHSDLTLMTEAWPR